MSQPINTRRIELQFICSFDYQSLEVWIQALAVNLTGYCEITICESSVRILVKPQNIKIKIKRGLRTHDLIDKGTIASIYIYNLLNKLSQVVARTFESTEHSFKFYYSSLTQYISIDTDVSPTHKYSVSLLLSKEYWLTKIA